MLNSWRRKRGDSIKDNNESETSYQSYEDPLENNNNNNNNNNKKRKSFPTYFYKLNKNSLLNNNNNNINITPNKTRKRKVSLSNLYENTNESFHALNSPNINEQKKNIIINEKLKHNIHPGANKNKILETNNNQNKNNTPTKRLSSFMNKAWTSIKNKKHHEFNSINGPKPGTAHYFGLKYSISDNNNNQLNNKNYNHENIENKEEKLKFKLNGVWTLRNDLAQEEKERNNKLNELNILKNEIDNERNKLDQLRKKLEKLQEFEKEYINEIENHE